MLRRGLIRGCSIDKLSINFRSCKKPSTALSHIAHIWSKYPPETSPSHHTISYFVASSLLLTLRFLTAIIYSKHHLRPQATPYATNHDLSRLRFPFHILLADQKPLFRSTPT